MPVFTGFTRARLLTGCKYCTILVQCCLESTTLVRYIAGAGGFAPSEAIFTDY
jgi:hypothetical protein